MFITLNIVDQDGNKSKAQINTSQIAFIMDESAYMSNGHILKFDKESWGDFNEQMFGQEKEASPKANEHTSNLLNEINKLCGGRGDAKPTTDRKARLKSRLKDFTEDELKSAAKNLGSDEFMQGANENGKRYGTVDYLLRTSANVNKWLEEQPEKKKPSLF